MTRKIGRNDPCTCGSGKKYKNCCGRPGRRPTGARLGRGLTGLIMIVLLAFVAIQFTQLQPEKDLVTQRSAIRPAPDRAVRSSAAQQSSGKDLPGEIVEDHPFGELPEGLVVRRMTEAEAREFDPEGYERTMTMEDIDTATFPMAPDSLTRPLPKSAFDD